MIAAAVFRGYPIATAFAVSGAVVGAGLALGGRPAVDEYVTIVTFWLLIPVVGVPLAYATATMFRRLRRVDEPPAPQLGVRASHRPYRGQSA